MEAEPGRCALYSSARELETGGADMNRIYLYNTGSYAKERLISILASDRIGCNPDFLDEMRYTIKTELERYINISEADIDIQVKEKMLIAYIPLESSDRKDINNKYTYIKTGQGSEDYEAIEEGSSELKTIQS